MTKGWGVNVGCWVKFLLISCMADYSRNVKRFVLQSAQRFSATRTCSRDEV
jgi:hypothetical protein